MKRTVAVWSTVSVSILFSLTPICSSARQSSPDTIRPRPLRLSRALKQRRMALQRGNLANPEILKARKAITLYLRNGLKQQYTGEQTTRLLTGRIVESHQVVKHLAPGRERIEYLSPAGMKGSILLLVNGRIFRYAPRANKIYEGVASLEELEKNVRSLLKQVMQGGIQVRAIGDQQIADQTATIVEIRSAREGSSYKRFWIDDRTGVRLKLEELDPSGSVVKTSYFTSINYAATPKPEEFKPDSLPPVAHEPLFPKKLPLPSIPAAQSQVPFTIFEPAAPVGYKLNGVWITGPAERQDVILRYSDGVNTFALFQQRPPANFIKPSTPNKKVAGRNGAFHWIGSDRLYTVIGNLNRTSVQAMANSTQ